MKDHPYFNQAFSVILHKYRVKAKVTQQKLAYELNCSESSIGRMERGLQSPSGGVLLLIANLLKVNPSTFYKDILDHVSYLESKNN